MIEVLVRRVLTDLKSPVPSICFLAFGDGTTPPSDSFLARFDGTRPALRSCGSAAMPMDGKQFEISTGKPGVIIHIIEFKKAANGSFEALVRFSDLPEGKNRFTYRLANVAGKWEVKGRRSA